MKTTITKFSFALIGLFLLAGTTFTANAQAVGDKFQRGNLYYVITKLSPAEVEIAPQNASYPYWNEADKPTGAVVIPAAVTNGGTTYTVTGISDRAFLGCSGLTSVSIPAGVTSIYAYAFAHCSGLTAITVAAGNTVYSAAGGVLFNYAKTTLIQYPPAKSGTVYSIPAGVTSIGNVAFFSCTGLTSVSIPAGVTSIGIEAFWGCRGLTSVTLPAGVTSIGVAAFFGCSGLTSLSIPASVTGIGNYAFNLCTGLTAITVTAGNTVYSSVDGVLFNYAKTTLIKYPQAKSGAVYSIPASVTGIGDCAFDGCIGLTSVTIPAGVTSIGQGAFWDCDGLTEITCAAADPAAITMGNGAFSGVPNTIPLYVPIGSKTKYAAADQWKDFTNIVEKDLGTGFTTLSGQGIKVWGGKGVIQIDTHAVVETHGRASLRNTVQVYNMQGQLVHSSLLPLQGVGGQVSVPAGIYIVKIGNGSEKVMVR